MSDKGSKGEREDISGKVIMEMIQKLPSEVTAYEVILMNSMLSRSG